MSTTFGISRGDFARALNTALKFAGKDDTIPMICGLDLSIHDGKLAVVGTDRYRVGAIRMDVKELTGGSGRLGFLGRDAVAKLLKVIQGGTAGQKREPLMVRVELGIFEVVDVDNTRIALHLQGSEFPRMDKILSTTLADEATCGTFHVNPDFFGGFQVREMELCRLDARSCGLAAQTSSCHYRRLLPRYPDAHSWQSDRVRRVHCAVARPVVARVADEHTSKEGSCQGCSEVAGKTCSHEKGRS